MALRPNDPDPHYGMAGDLLTLQRDDLARARFETYVAMEKRPAEQRWVATAKREIAVIDAGKGRHGTGPEPAPVAPAPLMPSAPATRDPAPAQPR
jgi:hypothetical protein